MSPPGQIGTVKPPPGDPTFGFEAGDPVKLASAPCLDNVGSAPTPAVTIEAIQSPRCRGGTG